MDEPLMVGVECGVCGGGPLYFETCGIDGCEFATAGECQRCGERTPHTCPVHSGGSVPPGVDE